ncbi:hypothetical protein P8631_11915 [Guyparkeria sp. 1SP6A2]|nr:hypothetical protein [Guyparkeria sp. 1SP6A2]
MMVSLEIEDGLRRHGRKGGKKSRRRQVAKVRQFLSWCDQRGVNSPQQIGKRHVHLWIGEAKADTSHRDRYYAVRLLWQILGRGEPEFVGYRR